MLCTIILAHTNGIYIFFFDVSLIFVVGVVKYSGELRKIPTVTTFFHSQDSAIARL